MEKNMKINFEYLNDRVIDSLSHTDLEFIKKELGKIQTPTIFSGVGGSSVVSEFGSKVLRNKNEIISINSEPRDFAYNNFNGFQNVVSCSYSGNNYGVDLSFNNNLKHYSLSTNSFDNSDVTYLRYDTTIDKERSFIFLGATLIPISILLSYYSNFNDRVICDYLKEYSFDFDVNSDAYEIFSGIDTSTTSKYLESTLVESGIGIPIVHDKYSYCHGRSTTSINSNNIAIYLNRGTELDKLLLEEIKSYYKDIIILNGKYNDLVFDDYQMLIQAMYLTKYIAEQKQKDLSKVEYSPIVKSLYKYNGKL